MGSIGKATHSSHGRLESYIHRGVAVGLFLLIISSIFKVSKEVLNQREILKIPFLEGNPWINMAKDAYDDEWYITEFCLFNTLWKWFLSHAIINFVLIKIDCRKARKYFFPLLTFAFLMTILGPKVTTLILVQSILISLVACVTGSHVCVWVVSLTCLAFLSVDKLRRLFMSQHFPFTISNHEEFYIRENILPMNILRSTSAALFVLESRGSRSNVTVADQSSKNSENENETPREQTSVPCWKLLVDITCYILYFPLITFGPLMTFKEFLRQLNRQPTADDNEIRSKGEKKLMKSGLWIIIYEVSLHYFYIDTILYNGNVLLTTNLWAAFGAGYLNAQMFMVRYFIKWTLSSGFAHLDYIDTVPPPACVYRIYRYTDMWKMFDVGFYEFVKTHIYVPMGGSRHGWQRQVLAMLSVFAFVFVWHGCNYYTAIWVSINASAMILEAFARRFILYLASSQRFQLSPNCLSRIHALVHVPIYFLSTAGSFMFLGGLESTSIIVQRLAFEGFPISVICSIIVSYCFIQTSKDYENYVHNNAFRQKNVEK